MQLHEMENAKTLNLKLFLAETFVVSPHTHAFPKLLQSSNYFKSLTFNSYKLSPFSKPLQYCWVDKNYRCKKSWQMSARPLLSSASTVRAPAKTCLKASEETKTQRFHFLRENRFHVETITEKNSTLARVSFQKQSRNECFKKKNEITFDYSVSSTNAV